MKPNGDIVDVCAGSGKVGLNSAQADLVKQLGGVALNMPLEDAEMTALSYVKKPKMDAVGRRGVAVIVPVLHEFAYGFWCYTGRAS